MDRPPVLPLYSALLVAAAALLTLLAAPPPSQAQGFYLSSGVSVPHSPGGFGSYYDAGYSFSSGLLVPIYYYTHVGLEGSYNRFPFDETHFQDQTGVLAADRGSYLSTITSRLFVELSYPVPFYQKPIVYASGGVGLYRFGGEPVSVEDDEVDLTVYDLPDPEGVGASLSTSVGVSLNLAAGIRLFIEPMLSYAFVGQRLTYFTFRFGFGK